MVVITPADGPNVLDASVHALVERVRVEYLAGGAGSQSLLYVGSHAARVLSALARRESLGRVTLTGIEFSQELASSVRQTIQDVGQSDRINIKTGGLGERYFENNSHDLIFSLSDFHTWPDPIRMLQEIGRILKTPGVAVIQDLRRDASSAAKDQLQRLRASLGLPLFNFQKTYTPFEVRQMIAKLGDDLLATIQATGRGRRALGYQLCLRKPVRGTPVDQL